MLLRVCLIFSMIALMNIVYAKVYKTVHEDGTVTYSDTPSAGAIEVEIKSTITTIPASPLKPPKTSLQNTIKKKSYQLSVLQPNDEQTIRSNSGDITIAAALEPKLAGLFTLSLSGTDYQSPTGMFALKNVDRGEHTYQIHFTDNTGKVIASTPPRKLYLHRTSLINRPN
ncbi:DUF4124 domain-containing protein [Agaribacter marinus]|uniref:DUF4124 domain-containing protein n=1 Tax=Agaribacter marinus TaxID=1431249 RepID=A0AA37T098_9ALTE|nr:DUF4124 domain-containing protein [Agaribacter marinus]GLR72517.1 hypothetical protein GCM10007852_34250 [Agaribacter marinus]